MDAGSLSVAPTLDEQRECEGTALGPDQSLAHRRVLAQSWASTSTGGTWGSGAPGRKRLRLRACRLMFFRVRSSTRGVL